MRGLAVSLLLLAGCFSGPKYRGPTSRHFDGEVFRNQRPIKPKGLTDVVRWRLTSEGSLDWGEFRDAPAGPPPPSRVDGGQLRVTFVNHATALIQMDGINVLTDPIWSDRCSPVSFLGPHRIRPPGIRFEDLPPLDLVVVSHNHYDHLDLATLARIADAHPNAKFVIGLGNGLLLQGEGIVRTRELDWWEEEPVRDGVSVFSVPAQHFSNRGLTDRGRTLWAGYVLSGPSGKVYFAGDTGWGPHFAQIQQRFGPMRLSLLPIGAFRPRWFMAPVHIGPSEAVDAHQALASQTSVAIHFGTFPLGEEGPTEATEELARVLRVRQSEARFWVLGFGEGREVP